VNAAVAVFSLGCLLTVLPVIYEMTNVLFYILPDSAFLQS